MTGHAVDAAGPDDPVGGDREPPRPDREPPRRHGQPRRTAGCCAGGDDAPVLPRGSEADRDEAWGDRSYSAERDADWYRRQRPPHHG